MKKSKNSSVISWIILIAAVLVVIGGVLYFKDDRSEKNNSSLRRVDNEYYSFEYFDILFDTMQTNSKLPPDFKVDNLGIKLMDPKYSSKIGKRQCSPGEAPDVSVLCTTENQPGIAFIVLNDSIDNLVLKYKDFPISNAIIRGKKFVTFGIGVEGSGKSYYFHPLKSNKTLAIIRNFEVNNTYNPSTAVFNTIIATLVIK